MRYVYFSKSLQELDVAALIRFCQAVGLDGLDLAVRPGYPIHPDNAERALPQAAKQVREAGLIIGLVTAPTHLIAPEDAMAQRLYDACARARVPAIKIGYFPYRGDFERDLAAAQKALEGFARLSEKTGVRTCYHTHSGGHLGNNGAGLRLLLAHCDPHYVGVFADTGHLALGGGPIAMELDMVRSWLALLAIKDIAWDKQGDSWRFLVVPAGRGIVRWADVARAVKQVRFDGTVSLHGEYELSDLDERQRVAREELIYLKKLLGDPAH